MLGLINARIYNIRAWIEYGKVYLTVFVTLRLTLSSSVLCLQYARESWTVE